MNITKDTKLKDILNTYPWLLDEAIKLNPKFKMAKTPVGKKMLKKATIADASQRSGIDAEVIIQKVQELIARAR